MSVLSGPEITRLVKLAKQAKTAGLSPPVPSIEIEPFSEALSGPNSYDMRLSPQMRVYALSSVRRIHPELFRGYYPNTILPVGLDAREVVETIPFTIPEDGLWLQPGVLYLGATVETTVCHGLVPCIETRSSVARLGLSTHLCAGFGDDGFSGQWTLEITVPCHSVKVYPGMRIAQVAFTTLVGDRKPYEGKYQNSKGPIASLAHREKHE